MIVERPRCAPVHRDARECHHGTALGDPLTSNRRGTNGPLRLRDEVLDGSAARRGWRGGRHWRRSDLIRHLPATDRSHRSRTRLGRIRRGSLRSSCRSDHRTDEQHAVELANTSAYGLNASGGTRDEERAHRIAAAVQVGTNLKAVVS